MGRDRSSERAVVPSQGDAAGNVEGGASCERKGSAVELKVLRAAERAVDRQGAGRELKETWPGQGGTGVQGKVGIEEERGGVGGASYRGRGSISVVVVSFKLNDHNRGVAGRQRDIPCPGGHRLSQDDTGLHADQSDHDAN